MRIDAHAHLAIRDYFERLQRLPGMTVEAGMPGTNMIRRGGTTFLPVREAWFDEDDGLRDMDRKGIDLRIVSLSTPNVYPFTAASQAEVARRTNDELVALCRRHPGRYRAVISLPLADIDASLSELDRVRGEPEVVGVLVGSNIEGVPLSDPGLEPVWARLGALRIPVFEHPMHAAFADAMQEYELPLRIGFMMDTQLAVARLLYAGVFERHPDIPFIVAHTGGGVLTLLERLDNGYRFYPDCRKNISRLPSEFAAGLYYDTCSFFGPAIMMAHSLFGPERLLFGTDYPFIDIDASHVEKLALPDDEKALIFGGNAARILRLGDSA